MIDPVWPSPESSLIHTTWHLCLLLKRGFAKRNHRPANCKWQLAKTNIPARFNDIETISKHSLTQSVHLHEQTRILLDGVTRTLFLVL